MFPDHYSNRLELALIARSIERKSHHSIAVPFPVPEITHVFLAEPYVRVPLPSMNLSFLNSPVTLVPSGSFRVPFPSALPCLKTPSVPFPVANLAVAVPSSSTCLEFVPKKERGRLAMRSNTPWAFEAVVSRRHPRNALRPEKIPSLFRRGHLLPFAAVHLPGSERSGTPFPSRFPFLK